MKVNTHVRDRQIGIECGDGVQAVKWLADASLCRYDGAFGVSLGVPVAMRTDTSQVLDMTAPIASCLEHGAHVWIVLPGDDRNSIVPTTTTE
ncbi:Uncharacterized protein PBTT_07700 [Plasmodiophora brassicae]|uniref:Uncharacterized protein n=1 Tax=Plasmodiophora brassicae TaxID=37360 RepID=A0A0G4J8I4_PLABS|nr:hypothetical protein PBRA_009519 [Plasmodiophora brassicae]SPQ99122.1 unnamed protein product [Plasmodiophora brassicae]